MLLLLSPGANLLAQESAVSARPTQFDVSRFVIDGNTLLPAELIDSTLVPYTGLQRGIADLKAAAATLQETYRHAGYGAVVVFVPEQSLDTGEVKLAVVEGKLADIKVSGNQYFDEANIRASLPTLHEGSTPKVTQIDAEIQLANENPAKELQVTLVSGSKPGDVDARIEVTDENPLRVLLGFDNTGSDETGNYRVSIGIQHANLWNLDHVGTLQYQTSPGNLDKVSIYSAGYRLPLYRYDVSIDAFLAHSDVDNGTTITPAGPLQFTGSGDIFGLRLNRHLTRLGEYDHRLILGWDVRDYENDCSLGEFGSAGCGSAGASVTVRPVSLAYTGQVMGPVRYGINASVANNLFPGGKHGDKSDFEAARTDAAVHYTVWRAAGFGGVTLPGGWLLEGRLAGQYSSDALVPGEQFGLGGANSVRGYHERERAADYGYTATVEAYTPELGASLGIEHGGLRLLAFYDYGRAANHFGAPCTDTRTSCSLAGAGIGVRLALGRNFNARLDVAKALKDGSVSDEGSYRGHIAANLAF
jgi:hemolysin activation/secretion protein